MRISLEGTREEFLHLALFLAIESSDQSGELLAPVVERAIELAKRVPEGDVLVVNGDLALPPPTEPDEESEMVTEIDDDLEFDDDDEEDEREGDAG